MGTTHNDPYCNGGLTMWLLRFGACEAHVGRKLKDAFLEANEAGASCREEDFVELGTCGCKTKRPPGPCSAREGVRIVWCASDIAAGGPGTIVTRANTLLLPRGAYLPAVDHPRDNLRVAPRYGLSTL